MLTTCPKKPFTAQSSHTIVVRGGAVTQTRRATTSDFDSVQDFHERCTPRSRALRYHGGKAGLTCREWNWLVDSRRGTTLLTHPESRPDHVIAMTNLMRWADEPGVLELAVLISDAWQGRRLGRELFAHAMTWARSTGHHTLCVSLLSSSRPLISAIGREVPTKATAPQGTISEIRIPLNEVPPADRPM
jgi:GNAT superfamily N-acetyltransferase